MEFCQQLLNALSLGAIYALIALGFTMVYGVLRFINFAHSDVFMIGAVVGVQAFGGEGLSGTGPKAGGPHYLYRFCAERTVTVNTTAAGGNVALLA